MVMTEIPGWLSTEIRRLVTPYMAELLKENGEVIFEDYDCYWWGSDNKWTGSLWGIQEIARHTER